jgi:recombinational DNA repair protein (RecF pathway)
MEQTAETETPLPEIFELTRGFLEFLCEQKPSAQTIFALELKLLHELGLAPDLTQTRLTPGAKKIIAALFEADWKMISRLQLSPAQGGELREWLHGHLILHLGRLPRGRAAALAVQD